MISSARFLCQLILDHLAVIGRCLGFGLCMSKMRELQDPHGPLFFLHDITVQSMREDAFTASSSQHPLHFPQLFQQCPACNFKVPLLVWARISQLYQCT